MLEYELEYEVATYLECTEPELANKRKLFASILGDLGASPPLIDQWLTTISWNSDGSGFGRRGDPFELKRLQLNGETVTAQPYMWGYTDVAPNTTIPWVQLGLVFEGKWEIGYIEGDEEHRRFVAGIGRLVWSVMQVYTRWSPDSAVFFNDFSSILDPWEALLGVGGNAWAFDIASVPRALAHRYQPVPTDYTSMAAQDHIGIARKAPWQTPPWDE